jgi:hypothetical protein
MDPTVFVMIEHVHATCLMMLPSVFHIVSQRLR